MVISSIQPRLQSKRIRGPIGIHIDSTKNIGSTSCDDDDSVKEKIPDIRSVGLDGYL